MDNNIIAQAYNATKIDGDANYEGLPESYRGDLAFRAQHVDSSGIATTAFEYKYKELAAKAKEDEPVTPLGTLHGIGEQRTKEQVKAADESAEATAKAAADDAKIAAKAKSDQDKADAEKVIADAKAKSDADAAKTKADTDAAKAKSSKK